MEVDIQGCFRQWCQHLWIVFRNSAITRWWSWMSTNTYTYVYFTL